MSTFRFSATALVAVALSLGALPAAAGNLFAGEPVAIGNGQGRVIVAQRAGGIPTSVSVVLNSAALEGLPPADAEHGEWEFVLPMPVDGPRTGFRHVTLDWNPHGHIPEGIYSVPHFDVHFYLIENAEREAIAFNGPERELAMSPPDATLVPRGYVIPPEAAVDRMGMHGLDPAGPEFHGQPFTYTSLYGYHKGRLIFVEPMVTLAHLQARMDITAVLLRPAAYTFPGYYPGRYRIGFNPDSDEFQIALMDLQPYDL